MDLEEGRKSGGEDRPVENERETGEDWREIERGRGRQEVSDGRNAGGGHRSRKKGEIKGGMDGVVEEEDYSRVGGK